MSVSPQVLPRSVPQTELEQRLLAVPRPRRVLSREAKNSLTGRQREILDKLGAMFRHGFAHLTMADLASELGCSLRTLYNLAPSRDELVMVVVDRNLWATGKTAMAAIEPNMLPLDALRSYLRAANEAVASTTEAFARDSAAVSEWSGLGLAHNSYLVAVTECLLTMAIESGQVGNVDVAATAHVVAGLGHGFAQPEVIPVLRSTPAAAANDVLDLFLTGLAATATKESNDR